MSLRKVKIHLPKVDDHRFGSEMKNIIHPGIVNNDRIQVVSEEESEYIIIGEGNINSEYNIKYPNKTVYVDYSDVQHLNKEGKKCLMYFKRNLKDAYKEDNVYSISYCVKDDIVQEVKTANFVKDIDISVFFKTNSGFRNRKTIANFIKNNFNDNEIFVGTVGDMGRIGRNTIQSKYYNMMRRSKIIVTCNPDDWEGDYRLFEACSSKALVFCDEMQTSFKNKFIDCEHIVYYDMNNLDYLKQQIQHYLNNEDELNKIAYNCLEFTMAHHKSTDKINEILDKLISYEK